MTKHINWFPPPNCGHYYHTAPLKDKFDTWQIHFPQLSFLSVWWHDRYDHDGARYDSLALCEDCRQLVQVCLLRVEICISCLFKVYACLFRVFISVQVKLPQDLCNLRLLYTDPQGTKLFQGYVFAHKKSGLWWFVHSFLLHKNNLLHTLEGVVKSLHITTAGKSDYGMWGTQVGKKFSSC